MDITTPYDLIGAFDATKAQFAGRFSYGAQQGTRSIPYKITYYAAGNSTPVVVADDKIDVTVSDTTIVSWGVFVINSDKDAGKAVLDAYTFSPFQTSGAPCAFTNSVQEAAASWAGSDTLKCAVAYQSVPNGFIVQSNGQMTGRFATEGNYSVQATVSAYATGGYGNVSLTTPAKSVVALAPTPPQVAIAGTRAFQGSSVYRIADNGVVGPMTLVDGGTAPVSISVTRGSGQPQIFAGVTGSSANNLTMPVTDMAIWEQRSVTIGAQYDGFPQYNSSQNVTVVRLPPANMTMKTTLPTKIVDTTPLIVQAQVGVPNGGDMSYVSASMGAWKVHLATVNINGQLQSISDPVDVSATGTASLTYPLAKDLDGAKLVVVADVVSGMPGYTQTIATTPVTIATVYGSPIPVQATLSTSAGTAPLPLQFQAVIAANLVDYANVTWSISSDNGATWADAGVTGVNPSFTEKQPGTYLVRASTSNKNSSATAVSDPVQFAVAPPPPPQVALAGTEAVAGSGIYKVADNGVVGTISVVNGTGTTSLVNIAVTRNSDAPQVFNGVAANAGTTLTMPVNSMTLWEQRSVTVTTQWQDYTQNTSTQTFKVTKVPSDTITVTGTVPSKIIGTGPLTVQVQLGVKRNGAINYVASEAGTWNARLATIDINGNFQPISDSVPVTGGVATLTYPIAQNLDGANIVVVADVVSGLPGYTKSISSAQMTIATLFGDAIPVTASLSQSTGPAPFNTTLKATMQSGMAQIASVNWLISVDSGTTWGDTGLTGLNAPFTQSIPGTYLLRAMSTNKNSAITSLSDPVELTVFGVPRLTVQGRSVAYVGSAATLNAVGDAQTVKWQITNADKSITEVPGRTLTLTSAVAQTILVTLLASNETDDTKLANPLSWVAKTAAVKFFNISPVNISFDAPRSAEVGRAVAMKAIVTVPWDNKAANYTINGQWSMPDGSIVQGFDASWVPTKDNFDQKKMPAFTGWVEENRDPTTKTVTPNFTMLNYVWPEWALSVQQRTDQAPALLKLSISAPPAQINAFRNFNEPVTYTWEIPSMATQVRAQYRDASFTANLAGDYLVRVTIADSRGNSKVLEKFFSIKEPSAMVGSVKTLLSTKYPRPPTDVTIRPSFTGGHPDERVKNYLFYVDDVLVGQSPSGRYVKTFLAPGNYAIRVDAQTTMNHTASAQTSLTIAENQSPVCDLEGLTIKTDVLVTAKCKDNDGRIKAFKWLVNGRPLKNEGNRIVAPSGALVTLTVTDDSGEEIIFEQTF